MAYTPINWQTGDTITAEKLNKMDRGWGVESTQLFSETVTTEAGEYGNEGSLAYGSEVTAPSITVTFGSTDYQCNAIEIANEGAVGYGGVTNSWVYDFTTYPFALVFSGDGNFLATETTGTYAVAVNEQAPVVSESFSAAVNECVDVSSMPLKCVSGETTLHDMQEAIVDAGRMLYFTDGLYCYYITSFASNAINYFPESSAMTVSFVDDVFTVTPI